MSNPYYHYGHGYYGQGNYGQGSYGHGYYGQGCPVYGPQHQPYSQANMPPPYSPYGTAAYGANMAPPQPQSSSIFTNPSFLKGAAIGAAAAYILSNEKVQSQAIMTAVKSWSLLQGGLEEMKERFRDAEAELQAEQMSDK